MRKWIMAKGLFLYAMLFYVVVIFAESNDGFECIKQNLKLSLHNSFQYCGQLLPIVIESSNRPSHMLSSYILQILLEEVLGYDDVQVLGHLNTMNMTEILDRIGGCEHLSCINKTQNHKTTVNLEVWTNAKEEENFKPSPKDITIAGWLGPSGQFGWFLPTASVNKSWRDSNLIIDHWRALKLNEVKSLFKFHDNDVTVLENLLQLISNSSCYETKDCSHINSLYRNCSGNHETTEAHCLLLLASYKDYNGRSLLSEIEDLDLDVSVAWLEDNLNQFVHQRTLNGRPTLFYNWTPNILTNNDNYTKMHLPACKSSSNHGHYSSSSTSSSANFMKNCSSTRKQFTKIVWTPLKHFANPAYKVIQNMYFTPHQYLDLLQLHSSRMGEKVFEEGETWEEYRHTACEWIKRNTDKWVNWLPEISSKKKKIYIGALFPITGPYRRLPGIIPGAQMAIDHINADVKHLANYELELLVKDTQCKTDLAVKDFVNLIANNTYNIAGILGPGCAEVAENIAGVSKHFNRIVISYSAEGLHIIDREAYPLLFRTVPPITRNGDVLVNLFAHFNWQRVVLLAEEGEFLEYHQYLEKHLQMNGIATSLQRFVPRPTPLADAERILDEIMASETRIIILTSFEVTARTILCQALKKEMTNKQGYTWFLPHWFTNNWWSVNYIDLYDEDLPCTQSEMLEAINGHLTLRSEAYAPEDTVIVSGSNVSEWKKKYHDMLPDMDFATEYASYVYDSLWVFALALDKLLKEVPQALQSISEDETANKLVHYINETNFTGVSGHVTFSSYDRCDTINVYQQQSNSTVLVGVYNPESKNGRGKIQLKEIYWYDGKVPSDRIEIEGCSIEKLKTLLQVTCDTALVIVYSVVVIIIAICILLLLLIIKIRCDKKVKLTRKRMEELGLLQDSNILSLDEWEINREHVVLNRKLGEGAFGTVYGGEAKIELSTGSAIHWQAVAVKTLKIGSNADEKLDFLTEADMMKRFRHNNIVKLLGVCTRGEPTYTIMEFMLYGDLKTFLLDRRHLVGQDSSDSQDISPEMLTKYALDIASGLSYLASQKYVHRDVACRNCLVHASKTVKLSDFGMTRHIFWSDYYRFHRKGMLPVRWMAPESLIDGLFRHSSDIWSYGIVLYEIMTFGSFPYQGLSNTQVLDFIRDGNTITLPVAASPGLKDLISTCWKMNPTERKTAEEIVTILSQNTTLLHPCLELPGNTRVSLHSLPYTYQDFSTFQLKLKKRPSAISSQLRMFNSLDKLPTIKRSVSRLTLVADYPSVFYWTRDQDVEKEADLKLSKSTSLLKDNWFQNSVTVHSEHSPGVGLHHKSASPTCSLLNHKSEESIV